MRLASALIGFVLCVSSDAMLQWTPRVGLKSLPSKETEPDEPGAVLEATGGDNNLFQGQCPESSYNSSLGTTTVAPASGTCWLSVAFSNVGCDAVRSEITSRLGSSNWTSPYAKELTGANAQVYRNITKGVDGSSTIDGEFQATYVEENEIYTDRFRLTFFNQPVGGSTDGCLMFACAQSSSTFAGEDANYCNLKALYCGSEFNCPFVSHNFNGSYVEDYISCGAAESATCVVTTTTTMTTTTTNTATTTTAATNATDATNASAVTTAGSAADTAAATAATAADTTATAADTAATAADPVVVAATAADNTK